MKASITVCTKFDSDFNKHAGSGHRVIGGNAFDKFAVAFRAWYMDVFNGLKTTPGMKSASLPVFVLFTFVTVNCSALVALAIFFIAERTITVGFFFH